MCMCLPPVCAFVGAWPSESRRWSDLLQLGFHSTWVLRTKLGSSEKVVWLSFNPELSFTACFYFFCNCVYMCVSVCEYKCPSDALGAGITGLCALPSMGSGNGSSALQPPSLKLCFIIWSWFLFIIRDYIHSMLSCGFNKEKKVFWLSCCSRAKLYYCYNLNVKTSRDLLFEHTGSIGLRITNPKHRLLLNPPVPLSTCLLWCSPLI